MRRSVLLLASILILSSTAAAHEIERSITRQEAVVVRLSYGDGTAFSYESYEVIRPGEEVPFQTGRTDAEGRISFLPDTEGTWRVRAFSEDGHGADLEVDVGANGLSLEAERRPDGRWTRVLIGLGVLLVLFGMLRLLFRRSRRRWEEPRS